MSKMQFKAEAIRLRKQGHTLIEIAQVFDISKSTAAHWCNGVALSKAVVAKLAKRAGDGRIKGRLMGARANQEKRELHVSEAEEWAKKMVGHLSKRDMLLAGIGLYWGEGAKARRLNFTNTDPGLLVFVKAWFEGILGVLSQDFLIRIYVNESYRDRYSTIQRFWMKTLSLPSKQFYKPSFIKTPLRKIYENRKTYYGVVSLRIRRSTGLQYRILGLIKAIDNADVAQVVRAQHS